MLLQAQTYRYAHRVDVATRVVDDVNSCVKHLADAPVMHAVMHSLRALTLAGIFVLCASCTAPVHHDMTEASANEVVAALTLRGFAADKAASGTGSWDVVVPQTQRRAAVQVLAGAGLLPARRSPSRRRSMRGRLVPSEDADRERRRRALEREVSATSVALPDVREARVHLTIPRPPDWLSRTRHGAGRCARVGAARVP